MVSYLRIIYEHTDQNSHYSKISPNSSHDSSHMDLCTKGSKRGWGI